ncbi:endo-1,4-beta-xylanase [Eubacterium xylanophilum]|uniref:endo-1,4-beta-xylanase n=1 Tax=Eubacterium xylanophilum TaxID=39497 RepID=UPI0004AC6395|nr:endo-1,4-beta-xylanase [Eubacterium xylanophilum]
MKNKFYKFTAIALAATIALTSAASGDVAVAKKKKKKAPKLNKKSVSLLIGGKTTLKVKNVTKKQKKKIKWTSKKKSVATVKKGVVKAKKQGSAKIIAKVGKKKLTCKVTVLGPVTSMKEKFAPLFTNFGTCINYNSWSAGKQLQTKSTMAFVNKHFNSVTMENEMKPDAILGSSITSISVAEAKKLGYVVPSGYKETKVPKLNFDTVDKVLEICKNNNLRLRAHTLVWHSQTPSWFLSANYENKKAASKSVMNARMELYIKSYMKHVMDKEIALNGSAGSIVYAWDVVNEYLHSVNFGNNFTWGSVYGTEITTKCEYVKRAFQFAYEELQAYKATDKVTLFYNDFNEYDVADKIVDLINYVNKGEKNKICGGIGMQSHVDVTYPGVSKYAEALKKFIATGLEVQITELDITTTFNDNTRTDKDQTKYALELMKAIANVQKTRDVTKTKGITGITMWGLYDKISWRASDKPLFFKSLKMPKNSYYSLMKAF